MFDFLKETIRETYLEINGIHVNENSKKIIKTKTGKIKQVEEEKEDILIMKKKTKICFFVVGVLLLMLNVYGIYFSFAQNFNILSLIKNIVLILLIISSLILLCFKRKKTEIASIIMMCLIALIYFIHF